MAEKIKPPVEGVWRKFVAWLDRHFTDGYEVIVFDVTSLDVYEIRIGFFVKGISDDHMEEFAKIFRDWEILGWQIVGDETVPGYVYVTVSLRKRAKEK